MDQLPTSTSQPASRSSSQPKETKVRIRRPRQPKAQGATKKDKTIKIKLTAKENRDNDEDRNINYGGGSEEEEELDAAIEEQMIFRVPEGEMCDRLHELVKKREIPEDVKIQLKENRKGYFQFEGRKYDVQLVELPTIIEAQKTLDKKQFYKVADISQMLLVDPTSGPDPFLPQPNGRLDADPHSYPHGLTPPLKHVRQRRFRKKLSKRAIEEVEKEVERLLEVDATAEDVQFEVVDSRDDMDERDQSDSGTQVDIDDNSDDGIESDEEDLADAIYRGLEEMEDMDNDEEDEDEDNDEDEDEDDSEEEDEDEDPSQTGEIEQKRQEIAEIKQAIQRKTRDLSTAPNAMLKSRFETDINNLKKALTLKEAHLAEMNEKEQKEKQQQGGSE